jgi:hypothetical protein
MHLLYLSSHNRKKKNKEHSKGDLEDEEVPYTSFLGTFFDDGKNNAEKEEIVKRFVSTYVRTSRVHYRLNFLIE